MRRAVYLLVLIALSWPASAADIGPCRARSICVSGEIMHGDAATAALRMLVTPLAWSTAAVARILKNAMTLENTTPTLVSKAMRLISDSPPRDSSFKGRRSFKTAPAGWQDDTRVAIAHF